MDRPCRVLGDVDPDVLEVVHFLSVQSSVSKHCVDGKVPRRVMHPLIVSFM